MTARITPERAREIAADYWDTAEPQLRLALRDAAEALTAAQAEAAAYRSALDYFARVQDCRCNSIEWDDEKCAHDIARAALQNRGAAK